MLFFFSFSTVSVTPVISKPASSRDLITLMISFSSPFENINVVRPDPKFFFLIPASLAEATVVIPNGTKTLLAKGMTTLLINGKHFVINGRRKLRNPSF